MIKEGLAISEIADGTSSAWLITVFQLVVYSASVLLWPIIFYTWFVRYHDPSGAIELNSQEEEAMFGLFGKKKKPVTMADEFILSVYGNPPPPKNADLNRAVQIAFDELLLTLISKQEITQIASDLNNGPISYSTHDLAVSVALHFFMQPERKSQLKDAQMLARMNALKWAQKEQLNIFLLSSFEQKLYDLYKNCDGVPKDDAKAAEWYQKAAAQGDAKAQYNIGAKYDKGEGVPKDFAKAAEWYQKAAAQGDAKAQYRLGVKYAKGEGVPKDAAKAAEWYQKAAAQGHAKAQYNIGAKYDKGEGVPKDFAKAVEWYQKAAAQGHADAQLNLGAKYYKGEGVPKDAAKAVEWYQKAAAQGDADAQYSLGVMYANGDGMPKDAAKAVKWWQKAAAQEDAEAQFCLGVMYANGDGVPKDAAKAVEWYQKAAAQGHANAQNNLIWMSLTEN